MFWQPHTPHYPRFAGAPSSCLELTQSHTQEPCHSCELECSQGVIFGKLIEMTAPCSWLLMLPFQENVHQWEQADPLWVLPDYVQDFSWALAVNKAWITKGGLAPLVTVGATNEDLLAHPSDGESKVVPSYEALPSPQ